MQDESDLRSIRAELARLGLQLEDSPWGIATAGDDATQEFIEYLRGLAPGATWRDVFPDLPAHWDLDDERTWTVPYRPRGAFDYQQLPTGPVVMVSWPRGVGDEALDRLLSAARADGWLVHGAGMVPVTNPEYPSQPAQIVLDHRTTQAQLDAFREWVDAQDDVSFDGVSRGVDEQWAPDVEGGS